MPTVSRQRPITNPQPSRRVDPVTDRRQYSAARGVYIAIVLLATLTHRDFSPDLSAAKLRLARAFTLSLGGRDAIDGLRNIVLFAGLGPVRIASIIDVTTDTVGSLAGALIVLFALETASRKRGARSYLGIPIMLVCVPYFLAIVAEALTPLFESAPLNLEGGPFARLKVVLSLMGAPSMHTEPPCRPHDPQTLSFALALESLSHPCAGGVARTQHLHPLDLAQPNRLRGVSSRRTA